MSMSWDAFRAAASALTVFQGALMDVNHPFAEEWNWEWEIAAPSNPLHRAYPGYGYLISRNNVRHVGAAPLDEGSCGTHDGELDVGERFVSDPCAVDPTTNSVDGCMCMYEFHVVYSPTYKVPLLYLRGHLVDGTLLNTQTVQQHMSTPGAKFISQDEHPVLGLPFYVLHPCETAACLSLLLDQRVSTASSTRPPLPPLQHLLAWLTLVQPCTRIRVPASFAMAYLRSSSS
ncbi:hypothetical protein H310_12096 [Aphanomyces invadans]|uniref:Ubiquitin-like-conjugating enzyme ATG10 n=1 Tax=Aphanomyces invadans TaxID=157072 RepID=A0A024TJA0_9STRA|nr:hypothetical protein H310_12096 [Aphanomyces invadans]ETV94064.1 hypothetical protein H310_12096 [Aphanomyces invadans]|eukprot:XP_008877267.1 hypothetical protein H310_12096 [Aphanomyces invadans]